MRAVLVLTRPQLEQCHDLGFPSDGVLDQQL